MGNTNSVSREDQHTKKLKCGSSAKFDEHNNKFVKLWSHSSDLMTGTNVSTLPTLKIDLSDHPFIKYYIVEVTVTFTSRGTPIGIITQYCEHHSMSYVSQSTNNIPRHHYFPAKNITNVCILSIGIK